MSDVLELSALTRERAQVPLKWPGNPDGELVELADPEDFGMIELRRLGAIHDEIETLSAKAKLTKPQKARVVTLRDKLARALIIGGPDEALRLLPELTKEAVIVRFFTRAGMSVAALMGEDTMSRLASSQHDSSASTGETPRAGSE